MAEFLNIFLHIDRTLFDVVATYGLYAYLILFIVVFCETGLVVTPILPGDSLLFTAGALAAQGSLELWLLFLLLSGAAILGDALNYFLGAKFGELAFSRGNSRIFRRDYLDRTHAFYERHGGKTIIIARFVPIIRTFAPFVAGMGTMSYRRFALYNVGGALLWVFGLVGCGYAFGNLPLVRENFTLVIFAIIFLSILPGVIQFLKSRRVKPQEVIL